MTKRGRHVTIINLVKKLQIWLSFAAILALLKTAIRCSPQTHDMGMTRLVQLYKPAVDYVTSQGSHSWSDV